MKRDMDLIRLLLLRQEGDEQAETAIDELKAQLGEAGNYLLAHHAALLVEAGFIIGHVSSDTAGVPRGAALIRLTWEGHNFLDAIRNEIVWKNTKEALLKPGASWTMTLLREVAEVEIRRNVGLFS